MDHFWIFIFKIGNDRARTYEYISFEFQEYI